MFKEARGMGTPRGFGKLEGGICQDFFLPSSEGARGSLIYNVSVLSGSWFARLLRNGASRLYFEII